MYRIVVTGDTLADVLLLKFSLQREGIKYELVEFPSGDKALPYLRELETPPHLIVMDVRLPRMGLTELLEHLKGIALVRGVPLVVMSGMDDPRTQKPELAEQVAGYIRKPDDLRGWLGVAVELKKIMNGAEAGATAHDG